jgi:hypothetical protein
MKTGMPLALSTSNTRKHLRIGWPTAARDRWRHARRALREPPWSWFGGDRNGPSACNSTEIAYEENVRIQPRLKYLTETLGSVFEIAGTFLLAVEAIKLENLQMVRLKIPPHISPHQPQPDAKLPLIRLRGRDLQEAGAVYIAVGRVEMRCVE